MNSHVVTAKRIGTGIAFICYPLFAAIAFATHPNLLSLDIVRDVNIKVSEFHGNPLMHWGHFMMVLGVPPVMIAVVKFMDMLKGRGGWLGFVGGVMALYGGLFLAVQKTALCLVMSAFDTLPEAVYGQLLPGIEALFGLRGYLAVVYLLPLLPIGVMIQSIGLYREKSLPRWHAIVMIVAMVGMSVAAAADIDLFGLVANAILAVSWFTLGYQLIVGKLD